MLDVLIHIAIYIALVLAGPVSFYIIARLYVKFADAFISRLH